MLDRHGRVSTAGKRAPFPGQLVLVVEDRPRLSPTVGPMCEFLGLPMRRVGTNANLGELLNSLLPMAIICELEGGLQDGCHIMKTVAAHDPELPIMLITGADQALAGAADAVEEIWGLSNVLKLRSGPGLGDVAEFLFRFARLRDGFTQTPPGAAVS